jgi:LPS-assembly protein
MQPAVPPFARLILCLCLASAMAEIHAAAPPMLLKPTGKLSAPPKAEPGPTYVEADRIEGHENNEVVAEGKVVMRNLREQVEADWLRYDQPADEAQARGNVVFVRDRNRIEGSALQLKLTDRLGDMKDVRYQVYTQDGKLARGETKTLTFAGVDKYAMDDATYTTCPLGNQDWQLKTDDLQLDYVSNVGVARHVRVEYMDVPILYAPWMDFSLDNSRKTGFLAPSYGASDERGIELVTPWYWNIAPNRDATISPRYMSKRGLQVAGEFRYLEKTRKTIIRGI